MHMTSSSDTSSSEPPASSWSNLGSDKRNVLVLIFLYVLQGRSGKPCFCVIPSAYKCGDLLVEWAYLI